MIAKLDQLFSKSITQPPLNVPRLKQAQILRILTLMLGFCLTAFKATASSSLVIAEVYGGGGNASATYRNDYVVIFNPTGAGVDVTGWSIQYESQAGTTWTVVNLNSAVIAPGGYYLVQLASNGAIGAVIPTAEATNSLNLSASQGKVALVNSTATLGSQCPASASIIDKVAYGTTSTVCNETANAPGPSNNTTAVQRKDSGCQDTDNNSADFAIAVPNPKNGSSPTHSCGGGGGPLGIATQPQSLTTNANSTASFTVSPSGTGPYFYQWHKAGVGDLVNGGNITGANSSTLVISKVLKADEGDYSVTITNSVPEVTNSVNVHLAVKDPVIGTQPTSHTNVVGDIADVFATAFGTTPMNFQWYRNNNPVAIGTYTFSSPTNSFSANLTNIQSSQAGNYYLVASNSFGSVTSSVVNVTVFLTPSTRIARWNFNNNSILPSEGSGVVTLTSTNTASFATGSLSDPSQIDAPLFNKGWGTTGYPIAGTGNKTSGIQFGSVSTVGFKDLLLTWEQRHSDTASKYCRLQYSSNGVDFVDSSVITMSDTNNNYVFFSSDLSGIPSLNNNLNFAFRIVSEFEDTATGSGTNNYVATVSSYGPGGTIRYDLMSVYGNSISTATPIALAIQKVGTDVVLTWADPLFKLQAAPLVTGTYTNITGATSPYTNSVTGDQTYFRLVYP